MNPLPAASSGISGIMERPKGRGMRPGFVCRYGREPRLHGRAAIIDCDQPRSDWVQRHAG